MNTKAFFNSLVSDTLRSTAPGQACRALTRLVLDAEVAEPLGYLELAHAISAATERQSCCAHAVATLACFQNALAVDWLLRRGARLLAGPEPEDVSLVVHGVVVAGYQADRYRGEAPQPWLGLLSRPIDDEERRIWLRDYLLARTAPR